MGILGIQLKASYTRDKLNNESGDILIIRELILFPNQVLYCLV